MKSKDWRNWKIGTKVIYDTDDIFGHCETEGKIIYNDKDHAIFYTKDDKMHLWIDDDTVYQFRLK